MEENRSSAIGSSKNSFSVALKNSQFQRSNNGDDRRKMSDNGFRSMGLSNVSQKIMSSKREERERSER